MAGPARVTSTAGDASPAGTAAVPQPGRILRPGETCWRTARAERAAVLVDAAAYFSAAKAAILGARHHVLLIGWDFDLRINLEPERDSPEVPDELGSFLRHVVRTRPDLRIRVLRWDLSFLKFPFRVTLPLKILDWFAGRRLKYRLDHEHPTGSCHHQKIVVVDDQLAFCGGIDMTVHRWDTPEHRDGDPRRVDPQGRSYPPWHDAAFCLSGPAARLLGELARERWRRATGERIAPAPAGPVRWPAAVEPDLTDVEVAIARTEPLYGEAQPEVREIEALYLEAIRSARRTVYVETQYFASRAVAHAIADRLREPDGPEIVVVNPRTATGWLEEEVMGASRAVILDEVRRADRYGRFRIYTPVTAQGADIYVHAKVLTVDDRLLRIGSSNLNNRSMGLDTECDVAVEAHDGQRDPGGIARTILSVRHRLVGEHLGVSPEAIARAVAQQGGSLVRAIDGLRRSRGRTLVPFEPPSLSAPRLALGRSQLLDPDRPESLSRTLRQGLSGPRTRWVLGLALAAGGLAAATALAARRPRGRE